METRGKRWLAQLGSVLMALVLLGSFVLPAQATETDEPVCYEHGDVNSDGRINSRDAIHALYYSINPDSDSYAVSQDCDFNHDGLVDSQDAIYLLYNDYGDLFADRYPLNGTVHGYYEPEWVWSEDGSAQVTFRCSCGQSVVFNTEDGVTVEKVAEIPLNCTVSGVTEYAASVVFGEQEYTDTHTVTVPAPGHSMVGERSCTESSFCDSCGYTLEAFGHSWVEDPENSREATCQTEAVSAYRCDSCGETYSQTREGFADHSFVYSHEEELDSCGWQVVYVCSCGETQLGEVYYQHTYTAKMTQEATCATQGIKTFTCGHCAGTYEEAVETVADAHTWEFAQEMDGISEFRCSECGECKSVITASNEEAVSTELLAENELKLEEISLALDTATLENLGDSVSVSVGEADISGIVDAETLAQIGDNVVYDFDMVTTYVDAQTGESTTETVSSFGGSITISLPYTLTEEDDPECIDVWFISDDGTVECVMGQYANGYVTFTTDHFSYYTVTRLTPAQRCEIYGHNPVYHYKEATCLNDGYEKAFCLRCGMVETDEVLPALGHEYEELGTAATCTQDGTLERKCIRCKHLVTGTVPALGHSWSLDETASEAPACGQAGRNVYICTNEGCDQTYTEELPQLTHNMELVEEKKNGCSGKGYQLYRCSYCGYEEKINETMPHGHYYDPADATVEWSEDYSSATVTLICSHDKSTVSAHTRVLKAVVSHEIQKATCQGGGKAVHTAEVSYNKQSFVFTVEEILAMTDHSTGEAWEYNGRQHYKTCADCGQAVYNGDHSWDSRIVTKEPNCNTAGKETVLCGICGYETEKTLPATGEHVFVNGICVDCGYAEGSCNHVARYEVPVDLSGYEICENANIVWKRCDCGEKQELIIKNLSCQGVGDPEERVTPEGIPYTADVGFCTQCGLTWDTCWYPVLNGDACEIGYEYRFVLSLNEEIIAQSALMKEPFTEHQTILYGEWVDLTQYGLCSRGNRPSRIRIDSCYCGEYSGISFDSACGWKLDNQRSTDTYRYYSCANCGAVRTITRTLQESGDSCIGKSHDVHTIERNGEVVYTAEVDTPIYRHNYQPVSQIMAGDSCLDGVKICYQCEYCDKTEEVYYSSHNLVYHETKFLGEGFCNDYINLIHCACGQEQDYYMPPEGCDFETVDEYTDWDFTKVCNTCGLRIEHTTQWSEKDENCYTYADQMVIFRDADGNVIQELHSYWSMQQHNPQYDFTFKGETCTDGVETVICCADCETEFNRYTSYEHRMYAESVDLGVEISCGGELMRYACPCGDYVSYNFNNGSHSWKTRNVDDGWIHQIRTCSECGIVFDVARTMPEILEGETCIGWQDVEVRVSMDEQELLRDSYTTLTQTHASVLTETELLPGATSCEEGFIVTSQVCLDCGSSFDTSGTRYGHTNYLRDVEVISESELCGKLSLHTYSCACGQESWVYEGWSDDGCDFDENDSYYLENEDAWAVDCTKCGATRVSKWEQQEDEELCSSTEIQTVSFRKDGKEIGGYQHVNRYEDHECVWSFNMQGTTCEEGYYCTGVCIHCGTVVTDNKLHTDCTTWLTKREVLVSEDDGACGDVILKEFASPCGKLREVTVSAENCYWNYWGEDEDGNTINYCPDCGLQRTFVNLGYETDGCYIRERIREIYTMDGIQLADVVRENSWEEHDFLYTFKMEGDTCADGYLVVGTCVDCGKTIREGRYTYCRPWRTARETLVTEEDSCGEIVLYTSACPCGEVTEKFVHDYDCRWVHMGADKVTGEQTYQCSICGLEKRYLRTGSYEVENCRMVYELSYRYSRDGVEVNSVADTYSTVRHSTVWTYTMYGDSCEDGYIATANCQYCDYVDNGTSVIPTHVPFPVIRESLVEYGLCGQSPELYLSSCACGRQSSVSQNDYECNWYYTGNTDSDTGAEEAYCSQCNTYRYVLRQTELDTENCVEVGTFYIKYVRDGETLLERTYDISNEHHIMLLDSFTFRNEDKGCMGGGTYTIKCKHCGKTESSDWFGMYHETVMTDYVDLRELNPDACGGYIETNACFCGDESYVNWSLDCDYSYRSWSETGDDGLTHWFSEYSCSECDITLMEEEWHEEDPENCRENRHWIYTLLYNGETVNTWTGQGYNEMHDYETVSVTLDDGSETCEDGVRINYRCRRCEKTSRSWTDYHHTMVTDSIDLEPYGAVCGSTLDLFECACGYIHRYDISDEHCDIDRVHIGDFVEGDIDDSQVTTDGYHGYWTYTYNLTCAVTDPVQCGLKIRMSEYWVAEGDCTAVEYQTWQLGYDELTGVPQYQFTVETGERRAYHSGEFYVDEERDGKWVHGWAYECPDCGSCGGDLYYDADGYWKNEEYAVNTLDNGENKEYRYINEEGFYYNERTHQTLSRHEYTYADGSSYWYQHAYTYETEEGCYRISTYTSSDGGYSVSKQEHGSEYSRWQTIVEPTCSQFGEEQYQEYCGLCDVVTYEGQTDSLDPTCHYWDYDYEKQLYICGYCGLENTNGASGEIVMEDMTDSYGNGENYVVGYWNRGDVEVEANISLILEDWDEDNQYVLSGIDVFEYEDITACGFSQDAAIAAAEETMDAIGYTGSYAIRFSFVPVSGEDTLDYAITFDSLVA